MNIKMLVISIYAHTEHTKHTHNRHLKNNYRFSQASDSDVNFYGFIL